MNYDEAKQATEVALADPQPGDCYHEMYSFWAFVVYVAPEGGPVVTMSHGAPCTFPDDAKVEVFDTADQFRAGFIRYGLLSDRGTAVSSWLDRVHEVAA